MEKDKGQEGRRSSKALGLGVGSECQVQSPVALQSRPTQTMTPTQEEIWVHSRAATA